MSRLRLVALVVALSAVVIGLAIAVAGLLHQPAGPRFPVGPTAERITVSPPRPAGDTPHEVTRR
jgi:hypothetical protein